MKNWSVPTMQELDIKLTANGVWPSQWEVCQILNDKGKCPSES